MADDPDKRPHGGPNPKTRDDDARGAPRGRWGNAAFIPTPEQRAKARQLAKAMPASGEKYIARLMGISRSTLREHFHDDIEMGRAELLASLGGQMVSAALDAEAKDANGNKIAKGDQRAAMYVLSRFGGWSTKVEVVDREGNNLAPQDIDLTKLTAAELEMYGRLAAKAQGLDPDMIVATPTGK